VATVVFGEYEWDDAKAETNAQKHGVTFVEAATVFDDLNSLVLDDGSDTGPLVAIGYSSATRILCVVHVERGDRTRIISARTATTNERRQYGNG
jgi:hypothetical protein